MDPAAPPSTPVYPRPQATTAPKAVMGRDVIFFHEPETFNVDGQKVTAIASPAKILFVNPSKTLRLGWFHPHGGIKIVNAAAQADPKVQPPVAGTWAWPTLN